MPNLPLTIGGIVEQLNIEGKRSGDGFVCQRQRLVEALGRAVSPKVELVGCTIGLKGFLNYLRKLPSGMIKVVPQNGGLAVVCGSHRSNLADNAWVNEENLVADSVKVEVSPYYSVIPNLGTMELAEALARVIPFTAPAKEEKPIYSAVFFDQSEGVLTLRASDGYRLAEQRLNLGGGEWQALIPAIDLKPVISAIRKARRVCLSFEGNGEKYATLVLETEVLTYRWQSIAGQYPSFSSIFPTECNATARFDAREALTASQAVSLLSASEEATVVIAISEGTVKVRSKDGEGEAIIEAESEGEGIIALNGKYLSQSLRACGGMVEVSIKDAKSPLLLTVDGYRCLMMPVFVPGIGEPKAEEAPAPVAEVEAPTEEAPVEPIAKVEAPIEGKKRSRKTKEPVAA